MLLLNPLFWSLLKGKKRLEEAEILAFLNCKKQLTDTINLFLNKSLLNVFLVLYLQSEIIRGVA